MNDIFICRFEFYVHQLCCICERVNITYVDGSTYVMTVTVQEPGSIIENSRVPFFCELFRFRELFSNLKSKQINSLIFTNKNCHLYAKYFVERGLQVSRSYILTLLRA